MRMRRFSGWGTLFRISVLLLSAAGFCAVAFPQPSPVINRDQSNAVTHVLSGVVVNAVSGAPVPYALVQIGQDAKLADQNGTFRFEALPYSGASVIARKPGYFNEQELADNSFQPEAIKLSGETTSLTIRLTPEAVISGHVTNPQGDPVEHLPIGIKFSHIVQGRRMWEQRVSGETDEDGNFRIAELKPGTYYVAAGPSYRPRIASSTETETNYDGYPRQYYPGVSDLSSAAPFRVAAGQHVSIEFSAKPAPAYRVSGVIAGYSAKTGVGLSLVNQDGESGIGAGVDARSGRFEFFPVPPGRYTLQANSWDRTGPQLSAQVPISVTHDLRDVRIALQSAPAIPIILDTEFTKPESAPQSIGFSTSSGSGPGNVITGSLLGNLRLVSRTPPYQQYQAMREQNSNDPRFLFRGIMPGSYDAVAELGSSTYVASMSCGGVDLLREPLVVTAGSDAQPIEATLRDDAASLRGSVKSEAQAADPQARVLVLPEGRPTQTLQALPVGRDGSFQLQNLPPGDYEIFAFDRLDGIEYQNREALSKFESQAAHVTLSANQEARVTVDLIRMAE